MSVAHRDTFDSAQMNAKVRTVAEENCTFRTGVEQQGMSDVAGLRYQSQTKPKIGAQQRLAGDDLCAGHDDVRKLRDGKQGLADMSVADIVSHYIHIEGVDRLECRPWASDIRHLSHLSGS